MEYQPCTDTYHRPFDWHGLMESTADNRLLLNKTRFFPFRSHICSVQMDNRVVFQNIWISFWLHGDRSQNSKQEFCVQMWWHSNRLNRSLLTKRKYRNKLNLQLLRKSEYKQYTTRKVFFHFFQLYFAHFASISEQKLKTIFWSFLLYKMTNTKLSWSIIEYLDK